MMNVAIGVALGAVAGVLDVVPMVIQGLSWDANLSAFSMWVVIGFFIAATKLELHPRSTACSSRSRARRRRRS